MESLQALINFFNSKDGKKFIDDYAVKKENQDNLAATQLLKFHLKFNKKNKFNDFVIKVINKYSNEKYINKWYIRGIEPPKDLYWLLFNYAKIYGRNSTKSQWLKYGNIFTIELFHINGYYFNKMNGQGTVISIIKASKKKHKISLEY